MTPIERPRFTEIRRRIEPDARVWCPRLELHVDVERCFDCQWLRRVSDDGARPVVVCAAPRG